jgi:c-di-GMP-binding flagellar brake protein YcgR
MSQKRTIRYARKPLDVACLLLEGGNAWVFDVINISATGIKLRCQEEDFARSAQVGRRCNLEVIIRDDFLLHVKAEVVRVDGEEMALRFIHIPEEQQVPLWKILGEHVDKLDT